MKHEFLHDVEAYIVSQEERAAERAGRNIWLDAVEDYIIWKENFAGRSTVIGQFDDYIHRLEIKALAFTEKNGLQPAVSGKTVTDIYFTESGEKKTTETRLYKQNEAWINRHIQKQVRAKGMDMAVAGIRNALDNVSMAYYASEITGVPTTVQLSVTMSHRMTSIAKQLSKRAA